MIIQLTFPLQHTAWMPELDEEFVIYLRVNTVLTASGRTVALFDF